MATVSVGWNRARACVFSVWGVVLLLATTSCSGPKRADYSSLGLVSVTGTVRLDGQPLAGATVVFENENRTFSSGTTDTAGRYRLMFNSEQPGIVPGVKKVRITSRAPDEGDGGVATAADTVPPRYNKQSQETVKVTNDWKTFDFDLKSDR